MVFHWSLRDSKSPQVSRTLLSILAVLNNAVVWMVSTRPPTSKSSSPFSNPLVTVPNAPITIGIIITYMFHSFFNSLARSRYLSFFSHSFSFILWPPGTAKSTILQVLFFFLIIIKSGLLTGIRRSVCMLKSHRSLCVAFSRTGAGLCIYHYYYYFYYYYYYSFRVFHISFIWSSFTRVWVAASFLKSPGLFSVFWPFSVMLLFGWSLLVRQLPSPSIPLIIL